MERAFESSLETHPLMEPVRNSIEAIKRDHGTFLNALKEHHNFLRESIAVIMDGSASFASRQLHLGRFLKLLEMHTRAEEETLYRCMTRNHVRGSRVEGLRGYTEHEIAQGLANELKAMHFEFVWSEEVDAKARVLAALVDQHLREEEEEMFEAARRDIMVEELNGLTADYARRCLMYLESRPTPFRGEIRN